MPSEPATDRSVATEVQTTKRHESRENVWHDHWELIVLFLVAITGAAAAVLGAPTALRTALGLPLVLFIPGYALVSALFPSIEGLDGLERIALGFGLSLALIPLIALGIEYSPWRLELTPIASGLIACTILFSIVAVMRRNRLPPGERFVAEIPKPEIPPLSTWSGTTRVALGIMVVSLVLFGGSGAVLIAERLKGDPMTEFAIYNADGKPEFYARTFRPGQSQTFQLEIVNHEGKPVVYRLVVQAGATEVGSVDSIPVAAGATWRQPITVVLPPSVKMPPPGESIPLVFNLDRTDTSTSATPYRSLRLFINQGTPTPVP